MLIWMAPWIAWMAVLSTKKKCSLENVDVARWKQRLIMTALSVAIIIALDTRTRLAQNYVAVLFWMMILTPMVRPITMLNEHSTRTSLCWACVDWYAWHRYRLWQVPDCNDKCYDDSLKNCTWHVRLQQGRQRQGEWWCIVGCSQDPKKMEPNKVDVATQKPISTMMAILIVLIVALTMPVRSPLAAVFGMSPITIQARMELRL